MLHDSGLVTQVLTPSVKPCWCRITPRSADRIAELYAGATKVLIRGGHCPHDDAPQETNAQLLKWLAALD